MFHRSVDGYDKYSVAISLKHIYSYLLKHLTVKAQVGSFWVLSNEDDFFVGIMDLTLLIILSKLKRIGFIV